VRAVIGEALDAVERDEPDRDAHGQAGDKSDVLAEQWLGECDTTCRCQKRHRHQDGQRPLREGPVRSSDHVIAVDVIDDQLVLAGQFENGADRLVPGLVQA
jgi:hypothetical protein